ncbi:QsdR family transcriptional regulator [Streptomyces sp. NPDC002825]|uniref:QsdR family transcriptional regulator n=1 Tax=Streptomyces TaxID=1883 RepID=UPI00331F863B
MAPAADEKNDDPPHLVRPSREYALAFARQMFLRGERVDMQTLAARLGVGRTTLYRWVGDRERLIGEVLADLTRQTWQSATEQAEGEGIDRALDTIRRFMVATSGFPPLRQFAENEPTLALRVLMSDSGDVKPALQEGIEQALSANLVHPVDPEHIEIMVQLGTALEWAPVVIGEAPAIDRAVALMRSLLSDGSRRDGLSH